LRLRFVSVPLALAVCALALLAVACGGGGGGSTIASVPRILATPTATPTPRPESCTTFRSAFVRYPLALRPVHAAVVPRRVGPGPSQAICPAASPGVMRCMTRLRTDVVSAQVVSGYAPADLQAAYGLTSAAGADGNGQIVAVVDAYDDPNAEKDLSVYRSTFALPPCSTANSCFLKVDQSGMSLPLPSTDATGGWEAEESLDIDMVSAVCPNCRILLVEANTANNSDLYTAEDTAATMCGANEISNSWNGSEYSSETNDEVHFNHPGVMISVASGDQGYDNPNEGYPATSQFVTSVGGTTLVDNAGAWSESVWADGGSRCSQYITQPSWQKSLGASYTRICGKRIDNDVAAVADPNTGVAEFDTFGGAQGCIGWCIAGGTSASTPIISAVYALAGNGGSLGYGSYPYSHASSLHDITSGSNGTCSNNFLCAAKAGYDGPTGMGTPNGIGAF
jgi:subtilase family serine protease